MYSKLQFNFSAKLSVRSFLLPQDTYEQANCKDSIVLNYSEAHSHTQNAYAAANSISFHMDYVKMNIVNVTFDTR
ncbi:8182_t:CDS:2 [Funneliformis geosporum]|nr:8182_t:CDS:2 [Funneliformis geosporum]